MHNDTKNTKSSSDSGNFKSPLKKLVKSFQRSRDGLRTKYKEVKKSIRGFKIKIRDLTLSRDKWKLMAKELEKELKELREKKKTTPR